MSFLNTIMLAGLAAVAVPIIIHLLNRRKFKTVTWAAMKFVKLSVDQNQRRMRIEDLILLLIRCALVALLALALARPALKDSSTDVLGQAKVTGIVILDNSYSMDLRLKAGKAAIAVEVPPLSRLARPPRPRWKPCHLALPSACCWLRILCEASLTSRPTI